MFLRSPTATADVHRGAAVGRRVAWATAWAGWMAVTAGTAGAFLKHDATPGEAARPPAVETGRMGEDRAEVLLFMHPRCPCSRATLAELDRAIARMEDVPRVRVVFVTPREADESWRRSALWGAAARLPGVSIEEDHGGRLAQRYGAATSGQVVVYRGDGRLVFSGGITGSRGHEGDNAGRAALLAALRGGTDGIARSPVYGCGLAAESTVNATVDAP